MGKVIALVGTKGGITKSTLALCLAEHFNNSCIIDLDPQGCLWAWYNIRMLNQEKIAGTDCKIAVEDFGQKELTLEKLDQLANKYDNVFIDCPGESEAGEKTRTALVYSDLVIIPVKESEFDITSMLDHLAPHLEEAQSANQKGGKIVFLPVFVHAMAGINKTVEKFQGVGVDVLNAVFRFRKVYERFTEKGRVMAEYAQTTNKSKDRIQAWAAQKDIALIADQIETYL